MIASSHQLQRRTHGAEFKKKVLAQCREPGASVASVALANGLNASLVRSWLTGRGLKRLGLGEPSSGSAAVSMPLPLQFVPLEIAAPASAAALGGLDADPGNAEVVGASVRVELQCGDASLVVNWPLSRAAECSSWLSGLASAVLKR